MSINHSHCFFLIVLVHILLMGDRGKREEERKRKEASAPKFFPYARADQASDQSRSRYSRRRERKKKGGRGKRKDLMISELLIHTALFFLELKVCS